MLEATTDETGRARFDGLRIGDSVRVSASIDREALGSGNFMIPAEGGVRMLLVSGVGAGAFADDEPIATAESRAGAEPVRQSSSARPIVAVDAASVAITLFAITGLAILWSLRPRSGRRPGPEDPAGEADLKTRPTSDWPSRKSATSASDSH